MAGVTPAAIGADASNTRAVIPFGQGRKSMEKGGTIMSNESIHPALTKPLGTASAVAAVVALITACTAPGPTDNQMPDSSSATPASTEEARED